MVEENARRLRRIERLTEQVKVRDSFCAKIVESKPLLTSGQLAEFILAVYGRVPQYLWYTRPQTGTIETQPLLVLWGDFGPSFGDIEIHRRLRIRNARKLMTELPASGETLKLEAIGYTSTFSGDDPACMPMLIEHVAEHGEPYARFNHETSVLRAELQDLQTKS